MPSNIDYQEFLQDSAPWLAAYHFLLALVNLVTAIVLWTKRGRPAARQANSQHRWLLVLCGLFAIVSTVAGFILLQSDSSLVVWVAPPVLLKQGLNTVVNPTWCILSVPFVLAGAFIARRYLVQPPLAWLILNAFLLALGLSLSDPSFAALVLKPDNVPVVGMVFMLGFFTWLSARLSVINDDRLRRQQLPAEAELDERVFVWPDLVYIELICMVVLSVGLLLWAMALRAPLEAPANPAVTPNPSKAPWYFLGLQEMLVYFDSWLAGVVLPGLIILGLMAIPYLDRNPAGNGFYTISQRPVAYALFQYGFLGLWITLLLIGTFLRGPGWQAYGPYESWAVHKVAALEQTAVSAWFWGQVARTTPPVAESGSGTLIILLYAIAREWLGLFLLLVYFVLFPWSITRWQPSCRRLAQSLGTVRTIIVVGLLMMMLLLPIKMLARWVFHLSYFVSIPEFSLNL